MHPESLHVLLVEDSPTDAQLFQHVFLRAAIGTWSLVHAERLSEAVDYCQNQSFDVALLDLRLPDSDGLETITQFNQAAPEIPIIILTATDDEELALQAMAQGAQDYLVKDQVTTQLLRRSVRYAVERSQIIQQLRSSEKKTLKALDKERELNQLKSYFVSMVSHEFRNPLSTLRVMSDILLRFEGRLTPEKKQEYLHQVDTAIGHMCQLLDEVILLGRVDTGKLGLDILQVDLQAFCSELISALQFSDEHQHVLKLVANDSLGSVQLDAGLLGHILTNLLSNALKYSPPGSAVKLTVTVQKTQVIFNVSDRGIGIPPADRPRLFETFSRCSNVGKVPGTGLGLAIVKRCVDLHHGSIEIDSEVGKGTKVTVILPVGALLQKLVNQKMAEEPNQGNPSGQN